MGLQELREIGPYRICCAEIIFARRPGEKRLMTLRVDEAVAYRLKVLAAEERTSVTALVSEGINHVFEVRGLPPIASTKS